MTDPTQSRVDDDINRSMDLFERADVGRAIEVDPLRPRRILAAMDGSTQDEALTLLARQLHDRLECEFAVLAASEIAAANARQLVDLGASLQTFDPDIEDDYDQILRAVKSFDADLILLACPFRRDFESLGEDSTGTVMEVISARSEVPAIFIRRPDATGRDPSKHVRIILTRENAAAVKTACWATGIIQPGGRLELLLLVEESVFKNFKEMMHSIRPDVDFDYEDLENALARTYAKLHAGLQRASQAVGFDYELLIRYEGDEKPITPEHPATHPALMALGLVRHEHDSRNEIYDFVRRSPHPVLVVPVD